MSYGKMQIEAQRGGAPPRSCVDCTGLLMVSAVGLAWVAVQLAVGNTGADFDSEFRRRLDRLSSMLATASCAR